MAETEDMDFELEWELDATATAVEIVRAEARRSRNLYRRLFKQMTDQQTHLDADIAGLATVLTELEAEITSLKAQTGTPVDQLDFTKADALVASAQAFVAPATASEAAAPAALAIEAVTLPVGWPGEAYSATLAATGGTEPYSWSVSGLPDGLTTSGGVISGTPSVVGDSSVSISVTDAAGATTSTTATLSVTARA